MTLIVVESLFPRYCGIDEFEDFFDPSTMMVKEFRTWGDCPGLNYFEHHGWFQNTMMLNLSLSVTIFVVIFVIAVFATLKFNYSWNVQVTPEHATNVGDKPVPSQLEAYKDMLDNAGIGLHELCRLKEEVLNSILNEVGISNIGDRVKIINYVHDLSERQKTIQEDINRQ